jgi:hypothetical protein
MPWDVHICFWWGCAAAFSIGYTGMPRTWLSQASLPLQLLSNQLLRLTWNQNHVPEIGNLVTLRPQQDTRQRVVLRLSNLLRQVQALLPHTSYCKICTSFFRLACSVRNLVLRSL